MRRSRLLAWIGLTLAGAAYFVLWHADLLSPAGRVRGIDSDAAIIGLMGKKMLEGRGFDIFFWGQSYIGPLTSMLVAAWGAILGAAGPLALRLAAFTEIFAGTLLTAWAIARIDARAAFATGLALLVTPPVLLLMLEKPIGAEMAFVMPAAILAVLMQHLTAAPGKGWLARGRGQFALGVLVALSWWMNQQVVFTLIGGASVLAFRSKLFSRIWPRLRFKDRLMLRGEAIGWKPMPGALHAFVWLMSVAGWLLLATFIVLDIAGRRAPHLLFGRGVDALILILTPQLILPLILGEWRQWRARPLDAEDREEVRAGFRFAAGVVIGYAPVWLGPIVGWYEPTYLFGFQGSSPADAAANLSFLARTDAALWLGFADHDVGVLFAVALCSLLCVAALGRKSEARMLLAIVPLANVIFYMLAGNVKEHYLISSTGMLFGLAALGALDLWDAARWLGRGALLATAVIAYLSIGMTAAQRHRDLLASPDPTPLLQRVRDANCAVCYAEYWTAYRYRFLDGEQRAWIPYLSQNRSYRESVAAQRLPGQRCLIVEGDVRKIASDLPLKHRPPGR